MQVCVWGTVGVPTGETCPFRSSQLVRLEWKGALTIRLQGIESMHLDLVPEDRLLPAIITNYIDI